MISRDRGYQVERFGRTTISGKWGYPVLIKQHYPGTGYPVHPYQIRKSRIFRCIKHIALILDGNSKIGAQVNSNLS